MKVWPGLVRYADYGDYLVQGKLKDCLEDNDFVDLVGGNDNQRVNDNLGAFA